jgi:hypothetical protein
MWLEFTVKGAPFCIHIYAIKKELGDFAAIVFGRNRGRWNIISCFASKYKVDHVDMTINVPSDDPMALDTCGAFMGVITSFLAALACVNVIPVETLAPAKLNKKRVKRGKKPILSHWTLVIKNKNSTVGAVGDGTHASPRLHLRRGHIREFSPGKYTWVQPCVVGTNKDGIITKDYKLEAPV